MAWVMVIRTEAGVPWEEEWAVKRSEVWGGEEGEEGRRGGESDWGESGEVFDADGLVGVGDLAEDAAGQAGEAVALGPGVEGLGEAGGARDEVVRGLDAAAGDGDVVVDRHEVADVGPVDVDQLFRVG